MMNREQEELEKKRSQEIEGLFHLIEQHIALPSGMYEQAAFKSQKNRILGIVNSKHGSELYDHNFLRMEELLNIKSVEGLRKWIDTCLEIVNYYEMNYENLKWIFEHNNYIKNRFSSGKLNNWEELLKRKEVRMKRMSVGASTTLLIDVLSRMPQEQRQNTLRKLDQAMVQAAVEEANKRKAEQEDAALLVLQQLAQEVSVLEQVSLVKLEQEQNEKVLNETREENIAKEPVVEVLKENEKHVMFDKEVHDKEPAQQTLTALRAQEQYSNKFKDLFTALFRGIHNYSLWVNQVSSSGTAPEVTWIKDAEGNPIKVPAGIYQMLLLFRVPEAHRMSLDACKVMLSKIAVIAQQRMDDVGLFSTRRSLTDKFYKVCTKLPTCYNAQASINELSENIDQVIKKLEEFHLPQEKIVQNKDKARVKLH